MRAALPFDVNMLKDQDQFKEWSRNRRAENGGRRLVVYYGSHDEEQQLDIGQFTALAEAGIKSGDVFDAVYVPRRDLDVRDAARESGELPSEAIDERPGRVTLREEADALEAQITDEIRQDPEYVPMDEPRREQNFQRWFGESKVTDRQGNPKVMYHGSPQAGFETFDIWGSKFGLYGQGSYFTDNWERGSSYADSRRRRSGPRTPGVYGVYLSIKNPLDMDAPADVNEWRAALEDQMDWAEVQEELPAARKMHELTEEDDTTNAAIFLAIRSVMTRQSHQEGIPRYEAEEIIMDGMMGMGYDGVKHVGGRYTRAGRASGISHDVWIAWDPRQIKSATGNRGTFSPEDPSILREKVDPLDKEKAKISVESAMSPESTAMDQVYEAPVFRNPLYEVLAEKMPVRARKADVQNLLKGPGVKADQLADTKIVEWLEGQPDVVTKEEVLAYVEKATPTISEKIRAHSGDGERQYWALINPWNGEERAQYETETEAYEARDQVEREEMEYWESNQNVIDDTDDIRDYVIERDGLDPDEDEMPDDDALPGALIRWDDGNIEEAESYDDALERVSERWSDVSMYMDLPYVTEEEGTFEDGDMPDYQEYSLPGERDYYDIISIQLPEWKGRRQLPAHFERGMDPIGHIRMTHRWASGIDGNPDSQLVMFADEPSQSDAHQQAAKDRTKEVKRIFEDLKKSWIDDTYPDLILAREKRGLASPYASLVSSPGQRESVEEEATAHGLVYPSVRNPDTGSIWSEGQWLRSVELTEEKEAELALQAQQAVPRNWGYVGTRIELSKEERAELLDKIAKADKRVGAIKERLSMAGLTSKAMRDIAWAVTPPPEVRRRQEAGERVPEWPVSVEIYKAPNGEHWYRLNMPEKQKYSLGMEGTPIRRGTVGREGEPTESEMQDLVTWTPAIDRNEFYKGIHGVLSDLPLGAERRPEPPSEDVSGEVMSWGDLSRRVSIAALATDRQMREHNDAKKEANSLSSQYEKSDPNYVDPNRVGDVPFKRTWSELLFKRGLAHAVDNDAAYFAWPATKEQVEAIEHWGELDDDDPKMRIIRRYTEELPRAAKKYLRKIDKEAVPQKREMTGIGTEHTADDQVVWSVEITDKLKQHVSEEGQSLYEDVDPLEADAKISPQRRLFQSRARRFGSRKMGGIKRSEYFKTVAPQIRQIYIDKEMEDAPGTSQAQKRGQIDPRLKGNLNDGKIKQRMYEYLLEKGEQEDSDRYQDAIEVEAESWFLSGNRVPGIFTNLTPEQVLEIVRVEAGDELFTREVAERVSEQLKRMRPPREGEVLLKTGHVETQLAHLIDRHDGKPPVDKLRKVAGAPVKGKTKRTDGMFTRSIEDIKDRVIRGWQEMPGQYRWYNDFGAGAKSLVGDPNMIEFSGVFAITSAQQPPRGNLADTLHLMATAREFFSQRHGYDGQSPLDVSGLDAEKTIEALTKYFVRKKIRPDGLKIFSNENQLSRIAKFYVTGVFDGGTKTGTYALNTFYRANSTFFPFTVNDVHVARGFGFVRKDIAKNKEGKRLRNEDGSVKYVENPMFATDDEYRYAQYVLSHVANDLGISPDQAQAAFWFYVKTHEAPSKDIDTDTGQGDGTYEDAAQFSQPEIDALTPLIDLGSPLTNRFTSESIRVDGSRGYQVSHAEVQELEELSRARGTRIAAALKPGKLGVTDVSFYTDDNRQPVPMSDLRDFYDDVERGIVNPETGKIKALELLGIDHDYEGIEGSWEGREPSMFIRLPYSDDRQAEFVASLFGDAFDQQAMAIDNPKLYTPEEADAIVGAERKKLVAGAIFTKEDGTAFTDEEMAAIDNAIDPKDIPDYGPYEGLHYSLINGRRELKLLNFTDLNEIAFVEDVSSKVIGAIDARVQGESHIFRSFLREAEPQSDEGQVGGEEPSAGYEGGLEEGRHYLRRRPESPDIHQGLIDNLYGPYASSLRRFIDQRGWDTDLLTDERDPTTGPVRSTRLQQVFDTVDQPGDTAPDPEGRLTRLAEEVDDFETGDVSGRARSIFNQIFGQDPPADAPPPTAPAPDVPPPAPEPAPGAEERRFPQSLERAGRVAPQDESRYYIPQSNLETRRIVEQTFNKGGLAGLLRMVGDENQPPSAERTAAGIWLHAYYMDEANRKRGEGNDEEADAALERAVDVASTVSERLTRSGQEVQAASMIGLLSPESVGIYAQRRIDKINEKHGLNRKRKAKEKRTLTEKAYSRMKALALKAEALQQVGADAEALTSAMDDLVEQKAITPEQVAQIDNFRNRYRQTLEGEPVDPADEGVRTKQEPQMGWRAILRNKVRTKAQGARERLREQGRLRAGIPVDEMADLVLVGVDKMAELGEGFRSWQQAMQSELATDISAADMHKIYDQSLEAYKQDKKEARREFAQLKKIDEFIEKVAADPPLQDSRDVAELVEAIRTMKVANEDARVAIGQEVELMLKRLEPRAWTEYLTTILHIGRLLAPKTAGRNIIGNQLAWYAERAAMMTAATIDRGISAATGRDREIIYTPAQSNVFGARDFIRGVAASGSLVEGLKQATPELREGFRAGYRGVSPRGLPTAADLPQGLTFDPLSEDIQRRGSVAQGAFQAARVLEGVMSAQLKGFDFAAYMRAYNTVLQEQAVVALRKEGVKFDDDAGRDAWISNWLSKTDPKIQKLADDYARYVTFQDDTVLATAGRFIKNLANLDRDFIGRIAGEDIAKRLPWKSTMAGEFLLAYPRVPANLINRGLAYSPAGILKSAIQFKRAAQEMETGSYREGVMALSRALVGSGGGALVWQLAKLGLMSGEEEEDWDIVDLKRQTTGEGKYRINVTGILRYILGGFNDADAKKKKGDKLVSYDWAQPLAISAAFMVNAQQAMDVKLRKDARRGIGGMASEGVRLATEGARGAYSIIEEQPMLTGMKDLFQSYGKSDNLIDGMLRVMSNVPAGFVPQMVNQVRQVTDNTSRVTFVPDNPAQTAVNKLINRLPFVSDALPKMYKTLGAEMPKEIYAQGGNDIFSVFFSPAFVSEYNPDPVAVMLLEPYETAGETGQIPRRQPSRVTIGGIKINLTPEDRAQMQRVMAAHVTRNMERFRKTGVRYTASGKRVRAKRTPDEQLKAMKEIVSMSGTAAKDWFILNRIDQYKGEDDEKAAKVYMEQKRKARKRKRALTK